MPRCLRRCLAVLCALPLGACVSVPELLPEKPALGRPEVRTSADGVELRALPNAWRGHPRSLVESYTPIWIHLINQGQQTYDVTYESLTLIDETGRLYAAIPPMEVARALLGTRAPDAPVRVAALESDGPLPAASPEERGGERGLAQVGFGVPYDPWWSYPFGPFEPFYPPYYYNRGYAGEILGMAFREGRLLPRTHAQGFVYFQPAYAASQLTLRLEAKPEVEGQPALQLSTKFFVKH